MSWKELFEIADQMSAESSSYSNSDDDVALKKLADVAVDVGKSWSGSYLGYQANVYYAGLASPPPGAHFSSEWGMTDTFGRMGTRGDWQEYSADELRKHILMQAGNPDIDELRSNTSSILDRFEIAKANIVSIIQTTNPSENDKFLTAQAAAVEELVVRTPIDILNIWKPNGQVMTRDAIAMGQGFRAPPHLQLQAETASIYDLLSSCSKLAKIARKAGSHMERTSSRQKQQARVGTNVFIGHGRSTVWRDLKDFIQDRLSLPWDEFNRVPVAGVTNQGRLIEMLDSAAVAFIVMTAEDENAEGDLQARMNVIHEVGLFQGRLGFTKAIVLLEEGCEEFSNIQGLGQIRFPTGNIAAKFEDIRQVLDREGVVASE